MSRIRHVIIGVSGRIRGEMGRSLIRTFVARSIAALGALALLVVVGRLYGSEGVGGLALAQSLLLGAGILARAGMCNALMRFVGQNHDSPHVLLYLRWAVSRGFLISLVMVVALWFGRGFFEELFDAKGLSAVLVGVALAVPAYTFGLLLSGFFKGIRMPATGCLLENGTVALLAGAFVFLWSKFETADELGVIGYAYALAAWLVAFQGALQVWLWCRRQPWWEAQGDLPPAEVTLSQFRFTSRAFFATNLASFMQQVLGVMIAGWLLSSADLGLFKSSQQVGVLIAFILIVINAIFPPRFAMLHYQGKVSALGRLARQGALLALILAAPSVLVCLVAPGWVLGWIGEEFSAGAPLLRIIALAQLVNVATGSVGLLLSMTGHEALMRNIALTCNALGLVAFFVLIPFFGALGAAIALSFVLIVQNLVAMCFVWTRLGIWTLPGPNWLALLGVRGAVSS